MPEQIAGYALLCKRIKFSTTYFSRSTSPQNSRWSQYMVWLAEFLVLLFRMQRIIRYTGVAQNDAAGLQF